MKKITAKQEELDFLKREYEAGTPILQISKKLNIPHGRVYKMLKESKVNLRRNDGAGIRKSFLVEEYIKNKKPIKEIAQIKNTTEDAVKNAIIRYGFDNNIILNESNKILNKLDPLQYQLVVGGLLGDSCISPHSGSARLKIEHGLNQLDYCKYKFEIMREFVNYESVKIGKKFDKRTNKYYDNVRFRTKSHKIFLNFYNLFYTKNVGKYVNSNELKNLDDRGVAFWFQDDGFRTDNLLGLSTDCFSKNDLQEILLYFRNKWDIQGYVREGKIFFDALNSVCLNKVIKRNVLPLFSYKLLL